MRRYAGGIYYSGLSTQLALVDWQLCLLLFACDACDAWGFVLVWRASGVVVVVVAGTLTVHCDAAMLVPCLVGIKTCHDRSKRARRINRQPLKPFLAGTRQSGAVLLSLADKLRPRHFQGRFLEITPRAALGSKVPPSYGRLRG